MLLFFQNASTSLGSLTVYRSSIQSIVYAFRNLVTTTKMAFQGIFLMAAFTASMKLKPQLNPKHEESLPYSSTNGGASLDVRSAHVKIKICNKLTYRRGLSYTYPGCSEPALKNVKFSLQAGETLAVVGYNGSGNYPLAVIILLLTSKAGKSTLARILLRIVDHDKGSFFVNGVDVRRYNPAEYHRHLSAVFQGFSKFSSTVKENVGLGNVEKIGYRPAIETAIHLAEADTLVESLPSGIKTMLETPGFETVSYPGMVGCDNSPQRHGLSGGEVFSDSHYKSFNII